jgi:hypothetical protein
VDHNVRRRHAVLLCQHDRRHGLPSEPLRRWLQRLCEEQLLRPRSHLLRSRPDVLRARHGELRGSRAKLLRSRDELQFRLQLGLPIGLRQIALPPQLAMPPQQVLQQIELRCRGELLRSGPELCCPDLCRSDLRCSDLRRSH